MTPTLPIAVADATTGFQAWSGQHLAILGVFVVGLAVVVAAGRRHRGTDRETAVRRTAAVALAAVGLAMQAYQLTPGDFDIGTSLPMALCDMATIAAVVALWTRDPRFAAFTYYVGLTLTLQAILTPSLAEAFPHPRFFGFWLLHHGVVWTAAYLTWGLGLRPTWRLYGVTVAATLTWAALVFAFNVATDTNYGYLNGKPSAASALDLLGPWPWYVAVEVVVVATVWALVMTLPWYAGRSGADRAPEPVSAP